MYFFVRGAENASAVILFDTIIYQSRITSYYMFIKFCNTSLVKTGVENFFSIFLIILQCIII